MGFWRVLWTGSVGMFFLLLTSYISFQFLDLTSSVTGGLIQNLNDAIGSLGALLPGVGVIIEIFAPMLLGLILIFIFPIHWCLMYRPDDVILLISVTLPWILACSMITGINAKTPGKGIRTCLAIGIGYLTLALILYFGLSSIPIIGPVIDGAVTGLTDLPYVLAVSTAILEGCLVGAVFGGFIGALKYKPAGSGGKQKTKKTKTKVEDDKEPSLDDSAHCTNCGAKLVSDNDFCTNCGMKL